MNFDLSEEQTMLRDAAQKFLRAEYGFDARNKIAASEPGMSREHWRRFGEFGWLGVALPEADGGFGGGIVETIQVAEALGAALVAEPYLASTVLGAQAVARAGNPAQRSTWLPGLASGELILSLAHTEVDARHDLAHVQTRATAKGGGWVLSGRKSGVLGAPWADGFVVVARTSGAVNERRGISLFLVGARTPGVQVAGYKVYDGSRAGDLRLDDVVLGEGALLGTEGEGQALLEHLIDLGIVAACADALGAMGALLRKTGEYVSTRKQFDVPIASFQVIQHRLVDMFAAVEATRSLVLMAALHAEHLDAAVRSRTVSAAKAAIGERARFVAQQAVQLHGGVGMTEELDIGHYFRRLTLFCNLFGSSDHHLQRFAALRAAT
ncbi:acyl-CoA dehydrogenase family protein [Hydrogenophaga pseudoflava]|jgi:alkylation response protein AidB-like acyl-CoA dehydrogenase|uniref:Acryloyl-CoA reductase (NADH) n=1 Tax=Hydrogenophaga pseudoflava TaxID=47421 RepID=A0A4P6X1L6_HYDPS|nr:acyl-CoA dehydrogenase family protein [Hydrogenophaga pseudoflava]MCM2337276.1 acyl-CoA dehydrogenase family protein [Lysobacter sp.]QBM28665.1 Acryloyl-CoA reductase (NADH) [Hydrogenophaga pseudoflava]